MSYAGGRKFVQYGREVWTQGRTTGPVQWSREVWEPPRADVTFLIETAQLKTDSGFAIESSFKFPHGWGGSTTMGSRVVLLHPNPDHLATLTLPATEPMVIPEDGEVAFWAVLGNDQPIVLPKDVSIEKAAESVQWALVLRLRLSP